MNYLTKVVIFFSIIAIQNIFAQNVGINTTGASPASTNLLEVLQPSTTNNSVGIFTSHSGNIAGTGYGIWVEMTGTSTTNIAGYFSAGNVSTNNYAIIVPSTGGRVGLGTTSPTVRLEVVGSQKISSDLFVGVNETTGNRIIEIGTGRTGDGASALDLIGDATYTDYGARLIRGGTANGNTILYHRGTGDMLLTTQDAAAIKIQTSATDRIVVASSGSVGIGTSPTSTNQLHVSSSNTTASSVGIFSSHAGAISGTGYGIWSEKTGASTTNISGYFTASGATNNYAIIVPSGGGNVGIGTTTPSSKAALDITSTTQGVLVPRMTKAQRDAISSPATSLLVYVTDGTPAGFYYYTGTAWVPLVSTVTNTITSPTTMVYGGKTLMVHTSDYSGTLQWDNTAYGATGATSTTNGATNTATIVAAIGSGAQAAYYCDTLTAYGFTDWYLPAQEELLFISNTAPSFVGFPSTLGLSYWSSTEVDASNSVRVTPAKGNATAGVYVWGATLQNVLKTAAYRCRCIRVQ